MKRIFHKSGRLDIDIFARAEHTVMGSWIGRPGDCPIILEAV